MADFWSVDETNQRARPPAPAPGGQADRSVRKEQITIRLDPGMIADARVIAARKGIGHHTLLRMWVMEGITRSYQEGVLDSPPQCWSPPARRAARDTPAPPDGPLPSGARWTRAGRLRS